MKEREKNNLRPKNLTKKKKKDTPKILKYFFSIETEKYFSKKNCSTCGRKNI
jgi:hypothetical protein